MNNMLFVHNIIRNESPSHFKDFFYIHLPNHNFNSRNLINSYYSLPPGSVSLANLQKNTIQSECAQNWNKMLKKIPNLPENSLEVLYFTPEKLKKSLKQMFILSY